MTSPDPDSYTGPLWVPGHPVTKGSMQCITPHVGGRRGVLVPDKSKADPDGWTGKLPDVLAWKAQKVAQDPLDAPVELHCTFAFRRPKSTAFGESPVGHGMGDLDKLTRMVGDAVGGRKDGARLITDDSRISRIIAEKIYAPDGKEGATIELRRYTPPPEIPRGPMPVRLTAGRLSVNLGSIADVSSLPALLRQAADRLERNAHA
jgi:Holliday junction resolvase RusA-like endonuclease